MDLFRGYRLNSCTINATSLGNPCPSTWEVEATVFVKKCDHALQVYKLVFWHSLAQEHSQSTCMKDSAETTKVLFWPPVLCSTSNASLVMSLVRRILPLKPSMDKLSLWLFRGILMMLVLEKSFGRHTMSRSYVKCWVVGLEGFTGNFFTNWLGSDAFTLWNGKKIQDFYCDNVNHRSDVLHSLTSQTLLGSLASETTTNSCMNNSYFPFSCFRFFIWGDWKSSDSEP